MSDDSPDRYSVSSAPVRSKRSMLRSAINRSGFNAARPSSARTPATSTARGSHRPVIRIPAIAMSTNTTPSHTSVVMTISLSVLNPYACWYSHIRWIAEITTTIDAAQRIPTSSRSRSRSAALPRPATRITTLSTSSVSADTTAAARTLTGVLGIRQSLGLQHVGVTAEQHSGLHCNECDEQRVEHPNGSAHSHRGTGCIGAGAIASRRGGNRTR